VLLLLDKVLDLNLSPRALVCNVADVNNTQVGIIMAKS
jgi:hypothetical protein